jgi:hypothetical protein
MHPNRLLELLDILRPTLSERRLRLTIALLAFFRCSIYLEAGQSCPRGRVGDAPTGLRPPFLFCCAACSGGMPTSASGVDSMDSSEPSGSGSFLSIDILSAIAWRSDLRRAPPRHDPNAAAVGPRTPRLRQRPSDSGRRCRLWLYTGWRVHPMTVRLQECWSRARLPVSGGPRSSEPVVRLIRRARAEGLIETIEERDRMKICVPNENLGV